MVSSRDTCLFMSSSVEHHRCYLPPTTLTVNVFHARGMRSGTTLLSTAITALLLGLILRQDVVYSTGTNTSYPTRYISPRLPLVSVRWKRFSNVLDLLLEQFFRDVTRDKWKNEFSFHFVFIGYWNDYLNDWG